VCGWRVEGVLPPTTRAVLIAAPHTSNWDLPFMLAVGWAYGVRPSWLGKRELFRWPFGGVMRWLGGIPVDRRSRQNLVQQAVAVLEKAQALTLVIPPSGTRSRAPYWKSGFYHIARGARVPIVCGFLDYARRVGGIGPVFEPTGDIEADMLVIRDFYAGIAGKYPERAAPVRLKDGEDETADPVAGTGRSS
jgi:1-acyl-sn-glycerol-3-phosphate acyltransferase